MLLAAPELVYNFQTKAMISALSNPGKTVKLPLQLFAVFQ